MYFVIGEQKKKNSPNKSNASYANISKYLHFRIQHEITATAPNMNAANAHQVTDYDCHVSEIWKENMVKND